MTEHEHELPQREIPPWDDPTEDPYRALSAVLVYQAGIQARADREYDRAVFVRQMAELGVEEADLGEDPDGVLEAVTRQHRRIEDIVARWLPAYINALGVRHRDTAPLSTLLGSLGAVGLTVARRVHIGDGGSPMDLVVGNIGIIYRPLGSTPVLEHDLTRYAASGRFRYLIVVTKGAKHRKLSGLQVQSPGGLITVELAKIR